MNTEIVVAIESAMIPQYQRAFGEKTYSFVDLGTIFSALVKCSLPSFSSSMRIGVVDSGFSLTFWSNICLSSSVFSGFSSAIVSSMRLFISSLVGSGVMLFHPSVLGETNC